MRGSDVVTGHIDENGVGQVIDRWAEHRALPEADEQQDVRDTEVEIKNNVLYIAFTRDLDVNNIIEWKRKKKKKRKKERIMYIYIRRLGIVLIDQ